MGRRWPALVLILFCLPLFIGLRSVDLETDEAIYSYAVDRILENGSWLEPKLSPFENEPFLEKPPLKFWIVAAPIKGGLLPDDEFGFRLWDAVMGGVAFLYVFAIGYRLAGPVCGIVAVLLLFVHTPLLFEHGIRGNNMEAPLLLAYCGGVFHFLRWSQGQEGPADAPVAGRRGQHAWAVGLYVVLGFMTKFVAVIFLPAILGLSALLFRSTRTSLLAGWRQWLAVIGGALALIAPWFIYAQIRFGGLLWRTILGEHVYARFTAGLDRSHLEPWFYYYTHLWQSFAASHSAWLVSAGFVVLIVLTILRRSFAGTVIVLWAVLPLPLISLGTSKLYHYAYPFLPPLALGAGYLVALVVMLAPVQVRRIGVWIEDAVARSLPRLSAAANHRGVQAMSTVIIWIAAGLAIGTLLLGAVWIGYGRTTLFRNAHVLRPAILIFVAAVAARRSARVAVLLVSVGVGTLLPFAAYRDVFADARQQRHPLRDVTACIRQVDAALPSGPRGLYVDSDGSFWHPINFYFRRVQPWTRQVAPSAAALDSMLHDPAVMRPSLVMERRYSDYLTGAESARFPTARSAPIMNLLEYSLLLPGPYAVCSPEAAVTAPARS